MAATDNIAIVIITHNREQKLKNLLDSIQKNTPETYNIYILDNGSKYPINIDKYKIYRTEKNLYPGQARNYLFNRLQDEKYVVTLDDDMIVTEGWLYNLLAVLLEKNCAGVGARIIQESSNKIHSQGGYFEIQENFIIFKEYYRRKPADFKKNITIECDWLASGCSLFKREITDKFKFDENLPNMEDPIHSYEIKKAGYKLYSTGKSVVIHTKGPTSNPNMRSKANLIKSICYIHQKYNLNPVLSWRMDSLLNVKRYRIEHWLYHQKVRLGMIKPDKKPKIIQKFQKPIKVVHKNKKYSIIIPYRNRAEHLKLLLSCLYRQTVNIFEIIVVNTGSRSIFKTIPISKKIKNLNEIKVSYIGPFSRAFACNIGAKSAQYERLIFLDADIIMHEKFMEYLYNLSPYIAHIPVINLDYNNTMSILNNGELSYNLFLELSSKYRISSSCSQIIVPKETFISIGGYDEQFVGYGFEDLDMFERLRKINSIDNKELILNNVILMHLYHDQIFNNCSFFCEFSCNNLRSNPRIGRINGIVHHKMCRWC